MAKKVSVFNVAKKIRKKGEDWQHAIERARKQQKPTRKKAAVKKRAAVSGTGKKKKPAKRVNIKNSVVSISGMSSHVAMKHISGINTDILKIEKLIPTLPMKQRKGQRSLLSSLKKSKNNFKKHL